MGDLDAAIAQYIQTEIALSAKDISACAASREWFLTRLQNEIAADESGPQLLPATPFVNFGSYFKRTKVRDVDEFDVLVVIDSSSGVFRSGGLPVGQGQGGADPNHKYDGRFMKADGSGVSPAKILDWLHGIVAGIVESFDGEEPERDGSAIVARIASRELTIDLVPAGVFTRDTDDSTFYNIAKGNAGDGWTLTSPRLDIDDLDEAAEDRPNLKNIIRVIKRIKDTYNLGISSFALERAVVGYARATDWTSSVSLELRFGISSVAEAIDGGRIPDPFDSNTDLLADAEDRPGAARAYRRIAERLGELSDNVDEQDDDDLYDAVHDLLENE